MEVTPHLEGKITWTRSHTSLAISCRPRQDFIKPVWLARLSNGKASAMEPAPLLVTINEPLNLPCACVELEAIDRGISLHGCDNIGRVHTSANGFLFALVYRSCGTNSFESTFTCIERFLDANARSSPAAYPLRGGTWHPDTASMLRRQGVTCRCLAVIGTSSRQGRASASDLTGNASRSMGRKQCW